MSVWRVKLMWILDKHIIRFGPLTMFPISTTTRSLSSGGRSRGRNIEGDDSAESASSLVGNRTSNTEIKRARHMRKETGIGGYSPFNRQSHDRVSELQLLEPAYGRYDGEHLYGIQSVHLALKAGRRVVSELLVQEGLDTELKKDSDAANQILSIAASRGLPVRHFSKHDLNMLTDNKVHQGFVLRAEPLKLAKISLLPRSDRFRCVLALDEVWDPQNLGALLRTAYFLRCDQIVLCRKNSAPVSPAVSKASAGSLELVNVSYVENMMKFLDACKLNGWMVVGSALTENAVALESIAVQETPVIVVLGNEGTGIRTNILNRCDVLVKLSAACAVGGQDDLLVDSLNVSVAGGILLHHFLGYSNKKDKS